METRYSKLTELRHVSRYMRAQCAGVLCTTANVISFVRHGGKILLTLDDSREIVGMFSYVVTGGIEVTDPDRILVTAIVLNNKRSVEVTDSMRLAIRTMLFITKASHAITSVVPGGRECEGMMLALGFLPQDSGGGCREYTCQNSDTHTGAVIIERILGGTCETLVEV
jgi:hypothetical protein